MLEGPIFLPPLALLFILLARCQTENQQTLDALKNDDNKGR